MAVSLADIRTGMAAGCERLVSPLIAANGERLRQGNLMSFLIAAPFPAAVVAMMAMQPAADMAMVLAAICGIFGIAWGLALWLIWTGNFRAVLAATATILMGAITMMGGAFEAASPAILVAAAIPLEAWRLFRTGRATAIAAAGAISALALGSLAGPMLGLEKVSASGLHWLAPVLVSALCILRLPAWDKDGAKRNEPDLPAHFAGLDAAVLKLGDRGDVEGSTSHSADIFGLDPALLLGKGLFERVHVADRVKFLYAVSGDAEGTAPGQFSLKVRLPDGKENGAPASIYRPFTAEICRVDGRAGCVLVLRPADEEMALRRQLEEARAKAEEIEITKGRFLAAVSHELRTPLNAIIGFSDILLHNEISVPLPPKQAEQVGLIREAGGHLLQVVNAVLDVSKIESGTYRITREPFSLRDAVDFTCSMMKKDADEKRLQVRTRIPHAVGEVMADQRAVQQILINLLSNAIKFTPAGGTVRIVATRRGREFSIRVSDTGIGIAEEDLNRLCRPFMQVQNDYTRQFQGTGLGLSLVKGLVSLHGGQMAIESAPELGTAVTFTLPLALADQEQGDKAASPVMQISDMKNDQEIQKIA